MAVTDLQRSICRLIANNRIEQGESYVAGGVALNTLIGASRISRDIDLFHDTREALAATWDADRALLRQGGYDLEVLRERPTFVEAVVRRDGSGVVMQWVCDSAYRFFPLALHPDFGLTLHPFDLATNKVLALVGRVEVRDWIDIMECNDHVQHLGYLAWAATGKDQGYGPGMILAEAKRSARYSAEEVAELAFEGPSPNVVDLAARWRQMLHEAEEIIDRLPAREVGKAVLDGRGELFGGSADEIGDAVAGGNLVFHSGRIRGAMPRIIHDSP